MIERNECILFKSKNLRNSANMILIIILATIFIISSSLSFLLLAINFHDFLRHSFPNKDLMLFMLSIMFISILVTCLSYFILRKLVNVE